MGTGKKEKSRKERQGKVGDGMANVKTKGENFYRYCPLPALRQLLFQFVESNMAWLEPPSKQKH